MSLSRLISLFPLPFAQQLANGFAPGRIKYKRIRYLAIATQPDTSYALGSSVVLWRILVSFIETQRSGYFATLCDDESISGLLAVASADLFTTFCDADLGGNPDYRRFRRLYGWRCCPMGEPHLSLSCTESEYTAVSKVGCEVMWMRYLLEEFSHDVFRPSPDRVCYSGGEAPGAPV